MLCPVRKLKKTEEHMKCHERKCEQQWEWIFDLQEKCAEQVDNRKYLARKNVKNNSNSEYPARYCE